MSDPAKYRTKEEEAAYKERDPLGRIEQLLLDQNFLSESALEELQEKIKAEIKDAVQFAEESPLPDPSDLYNDVYVESDYPYITD